MFRSPILKKVVLIILLISLGSISLSGLFINLALENNFNDYLSTNERNRQLQIVNALAEFYAEYGDWSYLPAAIGFAQERLLAGLCYLKDAQGKVVLVSNRMGLNQNCTISYRQITVNGKLVGTAYFGLNPLQQLLTQQDQLFRHTINRSILWSVLITGFLSILIALVFAKQFSRPITAMNQTAKAMAAGNLETRVTILPKDELGELGNSLNQLAENLSHTEKLRKKMTADVAHDLRTPLATVHSHLEGMIDQVIPASGENLQSLLDEVKRLTGLVNDLQEIARVDQAIHQVELTELNLENFLSSLTQKFIPLFQQKDLTLEFYATDPVLIKTDQRALAKIFDNLLANALKYTPAGKKVTLSLKEINQSIQINLVDQGIGIAPEDLPYIFERFYRTDKSRNRESGGFGLGLTIVKELVQALGGEITVESTLGVGSNFQISFKKDIS